MNRKSEMAINEKTLTEQRADLLAGEYSPLELMQATLEAAETHRDLNCYITLLADEALAAARKARDGPLAGIPIAHKDIFCTEGIRTSAGSLMLDNFVAPYNATVVERLGKAGAIVIGKTNMDEFAMGSSNESSFYGSVKNPWDASRVPGGSSGGSAAAVAAGLCSAATGTDTGGSIRQPAALCGITGLKPTWGRVSRWGMIAFASSLDQAGPMARSAEDCALLLGIMAGHDARDATSSTHPVDDYVATLNQPLKGLKVGLCPEFETDLAPGMKDLLHGAAKELESQGACLVDISLPLAHLAIPCYYIIAPAECSANLARYDGVRFGYRCEAPSSLEDLYKRSRSESFGREVKNRIMAGAFALSAGYYDAYYGKAQQIRRLIKNDFADAFQQVDIILAPTTPNVAFKLGDASRDANALYHEDVFTNLVNLAGLPAMSMPAGFVDGLPAGVQLIGNYFDEARLLNVAHQFQLATDWHRQRPPIPQKPDPQKASPPKEGGQEKRA